MNNVDKIIFDKRKYKDDHELFVKLGEQLSLLVSLGYICVVNRDFTHPDIITLEFVTSDLTEGEPFPYFLYPDEAQFVSIYHNTQLYQSHLDAVEEGKKAMLQMSDQFKNENDKETVDMLKEYAEKLNNATNKKNGNGDA